MLDARYSVVHLLILQTNSVVIAHNIRRHDVEDELEADLGDLWALTGASTTASTIVIEQTGTYDKQTGAAFEWAKMVKWTKDEDMVASGTYKTARGGRARTLKDRKAKAKGKGKISLDSAANRTRTKTPTAKMLEYRR